MSHKMTSLMKSCKQIKFVGTFWKVPKIFYQLFTIFCFYREHTISVIHILMTNKSEELYSACIKMVIEIIPEFEPNSAASDFDYVPRNAFRNNFLVFILQDAYFIIQKLFRVRKVGLVYIYRTNSAFIKCFRCMTVLPLYLQNEIYFTFPFLKIKESLI